MHEQLATQRKDDPELEGQIKLVSSFMDKRFYTAQLACEGITAVDIANHYMQEGWKQGFDPSPEFSTERYLTENKDVESEDINPFVHYIVSGYKEGRATAISSRLTNVQDNLPFLSLYLKDEMDNEWYLKTYPDVADAESDPIEHYLTVGWQEGRKPSENFHTTGAVGKQGGLPPLIDHVVKIEADTHGDGLTLSSLRGQQRESGEAHNEPAKKDSSQDNMRLEAVDGAAEEEKVKIIGVWPGMKGSIIGHLDAAKNGKVSGWMLAPDQASRPMLFVDGSPVFEYEYPLPRPDVQEEINVDCDTGFVFDIGGVKRGAEIELFAFVNEKLVLLDSVTCDSDWNERNFITQLNEALAISKQEDAVAITCWEGSHNPIGRAKVLYDVVSSKQPTVLITYYFSEFGGKLWTPLKNTNVTMLCIPWENRELYENAIRKSGLNFDTVWICKPRFPSFELAGLVAHEKTSLILDFDDNEEHFSKSKNSMDKSYGFPTINISRYLTKKIPTRTAASVTLQEDFAALKVRHVREAYTGVVEADTDSEDVIKVCFVGTVRVHKRLLEASRAVQAFSWASGKKVQLHVYGDVKPKALVEQLLQNDVIIKQDIPVGELQGILSQMDVILTGFPGSGADSEVTKYQITSKIGDALSVGKPALVPYSESVADLEGVNGVYLFDADNFAMNLQLACEHRGAIELPEEFTIDSAYETFQHALSDAKKSPRAGEVFVNLPKYSQEKSKEGVKSLVLLWKQHDSGFYGRRVDQIARSYKTSHPDHRVMILEMMHDHTYKNYENNQKCYNSEHSSLVSLAHKKEIGLELGGVEHHQLRISRSAYITEKMQVFLLDNGLLPQNTVFIIFPIVQFYSIIDRVISPYRKIVDVVDNQLSWGGDKQVERAYQYAALIRSADAVVFNSEDNRNYFDCEDCVKPSTEVSVIKNWYQLPSDAPTKKAKPRSDQSFNVIYSGNMNDRIDWDLMGRVADLEGDINLHLVGTANRGFDHLSELLGKDNVIYYGPLNETDTLRVASTMDVAIMPHSTDEISTYMNPLKVHMYKSIGLPTVSTDVPGIEASSFLTICGSRSDFINEIEGIRHRSQSLEANGSASESSRSYIDLINKIWCKIRGVDAEQAPEKLDSLKVS